MYEVTILNLHACCEHKNNCIWIDHIATDHASIEYEDKGLSRILTQYSWPLYGTHHSIPSCIGDDQAKNSVSKKNGITHCFTTRPGLPARAESGLVAKLKVKGYSLWIELPPACCIEQRPQATPLHGAYCTTHHA